MHRNIYGLIIVAHPDDESYVFAGTTLMLQDQGKHIGVVCATRGEKGTDRLNRELSFTDMAKIRTKELLQACHILRCECRNFYDYPDGSLDQINFDELVQKFAEEIDQNKPEVVFTFGDEGISGHKDHIIVGKAVIQACIDCDHQPKEVWKASIPSSLINDFLTHYDKKKVHRSHFVGNQLSGVIDEKLTRIDVSKYKNQKIKALETHASQYVPELTWPNFLKEECFEVIKLS